MAPSPMLKQQESNVFEPEENDAAVLVGYERAKISTHNHVPAILKLLLQLLLNILGHVLIVLQLAIMLHFVGIPAYLERLLLLLVRHVRETYVGLDALKVLLLLLRHFCCHHC